MIDFMAVATGVGIPLCGGVIALAGKWILAGQKDIKEDIAKLDTTMDTRVKALEADNRTFMSKADLKIAFDHEAKGRKAIEAAATHMIEKNVEDIVKLRESVARLDQNDNHMTSRFNSLEETFEKRFDKTDTKLDKLCDQMAEISKKV